jgi:hypothetical protein
MRLNYCSVQEVRRQNTRLYEEVAKIKEQQEERIQRDSGRLKVVIRVVRTTDNRKESSN